MKKKKKVSYDVYSADSFPAIPAPKIVEPHRPQFLIPCVRSWIVFLLPV